MLDLHRLRLLTEFAARGSIAKTAAVLGYTPSAVSQQLAALEREAGTALLDRTARRAELTDAGRRLAGHAERILAMVEEAETDLSARATEPAGRVLATAFPSAAIAFAPALARSLRTHPRLTLVLRQTPAREGLRQVRSGEVDVAIVDDWNGRLADEIETGGSILSCYHLIRDQLVLVVPRSHRAADPDAAVDLRALRHEPWLAAPASEPSRQAVDRLLAAVGVTPPVLSEFEGMSTIVSLVARGIGLAILPRLAVAAGERRVAVRDLPHGLDLARDVHAVARTASVRRPSVAVIVTALRAAAKALPGQEARPRGPPEPGPYAGRVDLDLDRAGAALTAQLVDVPSVSGEEGPLADAIERALRPLAHLSVRRDGHTIVARTDLGRPERVILAGHIDTVPVAGNLPSRADGSRLYGCGTSDMKSGVAVQLRLAAQLPAPSRDVTYVFYECEEVAAERNGLLRLSHSAPELLAGDFAVLMEPSAGRIEGGCQGTLRADVTAAGKRAHTARSWMGRNAIHEADGILAVLRAYTPREPEVGGLRYHEGLNAVAIRGGVAGNVVPDECVVTVNYRFAPDLDGQQAADVVRSLFAAWPVTLIDVAEGARPGLGHPAAAAFVATVGAGLGPPRAKLGWTDVARFAALGIPAVNYGPGLPELAHTAGEYVETPAIADCEARLRAWLADRPSWPGLGRVTGSTAPGRRRA